MLSFGFIISASPFQSTEVSVSKLSAGPSIVKPIFASNASTLPLNISAENSFMIHCDGGTYGYNPDIRDCEKAKELVSPDTTIWTLGERHTGLPATVVPLPYRVMGNRGLCYIQPVLTGNHITGKTSLNTVRQAGAALILQCATGVESQGGIATYTGMSEYTSLQNRLVQRYLHTPLHPMADVCRWRQQHSCRAWNIPASSFLSWNAHEVVLVQSTSIHHACR